jgi:hypothetical protein
MRKAKIKVMETLLVIFSTLLFYVRFEWNLLLLR